MLGTIAVRDALRVQFERIVAYYRQQQCSRVQAATLLGQLRVVAADHLRRGELTASENAEIRSWALPDYGSHGDGACALAVDLPALPATDGGGWTDWLQRAIGSGGEAVGGVVSSAVQGISAGLGIDKITAALATATGLPASALRWVVLALVLVVALILLFKVLGFAVPFLGAK